MDIQNIKDLRDRLYGNISNIINPVITTNATDIVNKENLSLSLTLSNITIPIKKNNPLKIENNSPQYILITVNIITQPKEKK